MSGAGPTLPAANKAAFQHTLKARPTDPGTAFHTSDSAFGPGSDLETVQVSRKQSTVRPPPVPWITIVFCIGREFQDRCTCPVPFAHSTTVRHSSNNRCGRRDVER